MSGAGVLILAEEPVAGEVKPRLVSLLGEDGVVRLERELVRAALRWGDAVAPGRTWLAMTGHHDCPLAHAATTLEPRMGDIGERMRGAVAQIYLGGHNGPLFVIGTDCPQLGSEHAATALGQLNAGRDAVILPARGGGFCMVLVKEPHPELMRLPADAWDGPAMVELMLAAGRAAELDVGVMAMEIALATPEDARAARTDGRVPEAVRAALMTDPLVSAVIPVLDDAATLGGALDAIAALPGRFQVVVVDGGSVDATTAIARGHRSEPRLVVSVPGRSRQMNRGASAASGDVLLFLPTETRLPVDAYDRIVAALRDPHVQGGNFELAFDGGDHMADRLARRYAKERRAGIYYAESAPFVRREVFDDLGGYRPLPVMEDYDFVRRLELRGKTVCVGGPALTNVARWGAMSPRRRALARRLFAAGVEPERLARLV
jgi:glycosyltransferase A (GT-A) superfamily protein (DUF2064 family)